MNSNFEIANRLTLTARYHCFQFYQSVLHKSILRSFLNWKQTIALAIIINPRKKLIESENSLNLIINNLILFSEISSFHWLFIWRQLKIYCTADLGGQTNWNLPLHVLKVNWGDDLDRRHRMFLLLFYLVITV